MAQQNIDEAILDIEWWTREWCRFKSDFRVFLAREIYLTYDDVDAVPDRFIFLEDFKNEYDRIINDIIKRMILQTREEMLIKYIQEYGSLIIIQPAKANSLIRTTITEIAFTISNQFIETLANMFDERINRILNWVSNRLWDMPIIRAHLLETNEYVPAKFRNDINTLLKRVIHPAITLFIEFPRFDRDKAIKGYSREIELLDSNYFENGNTPRHQSRMLRSFLVKGNHSAAAAPSQLKTSNKPKTKMAQASSADDIFLDPASPFSNSDQPYPPNKSFDEAYNEISSDIEEFLSYLKNSVFYASGLDTYFQIEIDGFIRKVLNNSGIWQAHASETGVRLHNQPRP